VRNETANTLLAFVFSLIVVLLLVLPLMIFLKGSINQIVEPISRTKASSSRLVSETFSLPEDHVLRERPLLSYQGRRAVLHVSKRGSGDRLLSWKEGSGLQLIEQTVFKNISKTAIDHSGQRVFFFCQEI